MKEILENKSLLITGGTGSLGKALTTHILNNYPQIKKLAIYSRDEQKQFQMKKFITPPRFNISRVSK